MDALERSFNSTSLASLTNLTEISSSASTIAPVSSPITTGSPVLNLTSTTLKTTITTIFSSSTTADVTTTPINVPDSTSVIFISLVVFAVATALIAKIVYSHKKKRSELIGGSARWRISASRQSGAASSSSTANLQNGNGSSTSATYLPMGRGSSNGRNLNAQHQPLTNSLDTPGPDRLDWERQFFDDSEATTEVPSRLVFR